MELKEKNYHLSVLISIATGEALSAEKLNYNGDTPISEKEILRNLREANVPITKIVEVDLERIYSGKEPIYFVRYPEVAKNYQESRGYSQVAIAKLAEKSYQSDRSNNSAERAVEDRRKYGISLEPLRQGFACIKEQNYFYSTPEWKHRADLIRFLDRKECQSCNKSVSELDVPLEVHHQFPIQSMFSRTFPRNFDPGRLKSLCQNCHHKFHDTKIKKVWGYTSASFKDKENEKSFLEELTEAHDSAKECNFCF